MENLNNILEQAMLEEKNISQKIKNLQNDNNHDKNKAEIIKLQEQLSYLYKAIAKYSEYKQSEEKNKELIKANNELSKANNELFKNNNKIVKQIENSLGKKNTDYGNEEEVKEEGEEQILVEEKPNLPDELG